VAGRPPGVKASACATIAGGDRAVWLSDVRSQPPLTLRRSGGRVLIVGSAAGPVGGDELDLHLEIAPGACVSVGTVAATIVWPGPDGRQSRTTLTIDVGTDAHVVWHPCPTVSVAGSDHRMSTNVRLAVGATCRIVEELALGRGDEPSGQLDACVRIERLGMPVIHHRERFGPGTPGWGSTAAVSGARFVHQEFRVGSPAGTAVTVVEHDAAGARLPVDDDATVILAAGEDRPTVESLVARWR
jgi:urease accessory protein